MSNVKPEKLSTLHLQGWDGVKSADFTLTKPLFDVFRLIFHVLGHHKKLKKIFFAEVSLFIFVDRMTRTKAYRWFYFYFYFSKSRDCIC